MSDGTPVVSIVVRTHNRPRLLRRALADIADQEFTSWEVVVVDDGNDPDATREIVDAAEISDTRVSIIRTMYQRGADAAINTGVRAAGGEFIAIHDDDDTWDPAFLRRTVEWLKDHSDHLGVATRTQIVYERVTDDAIIEEGRQLFWPNVHEFSAHLLLMLNRYVPISMLIRKSAIHDVGGFREDLPVVGDWEFNLRLALAGPVGFLSGEPLAFWHQRPASTDDEGNTVIAGGNDHLKYDAQVRDDHVREYLKNHEIGDLLAVAGLIREQSDAFNGRVTHVENLIVDLRDAMVAHQEQPQRAHFADGITTREVAEELARRVVRKAKMIASNLK